MNEMFLYLIPGSGIVALLFVYLKNNWVASKEVGSEKMERIAQNISDGAMAFLRAEYKILSVFVLITAVLLGFKGVTEGTSYLVAVSFIVGALCSGLAGFIGMKVADRPEEGKDDGEDLDEVERDPNNYEIYINPQIDKGSKESLQLGDEGCLSIPGVYLNVIRPSSIKVNFRDEMGRPRKLNTDGAYLWSKI